MRPTSFRRSPDSCSLPPFERLQGGTSPCRASLHAEQKRRPHPSNWKMNRTRRTARAGGTLALAVLVVLVTMGCSLFGTTEEERRSETRPVEQTAPSPQPDRASAVYATVVRELAASDRFFARARVIYVRDGAIKDAAKVRSNRQEPKTSFSEALREDVASALSDLAPVRFVVEQKSVLNRDGAIRNDGILITLGPIRDHGKGVEVGCNAWMKGKDNRWLTYVVRRNGDTWAVTGTTGTMAIA
jgi:hypothetical protein